MFTRITLSWGVLVALSTLSFAIGHGFGIHSRRYAGVAVLVITLLKSRLIMLEFMELRHAPLVGRVAVEIWALLIGGVLIGLFLM